MDLKIFRLWLTTFVLAAASPRAWAQNGNAPVSANELQLVAAFTYNITKYVTWKSRPRMNEASASVRIGVYQNPALAARLREVTEGKKIDERSVEVSEIKIDPLGSKDPPEVLVLIPDSPVKSVDPLKTSRACNCLSITSGKSEDRPGSIVNFFIEDEHLRFAVDLKRAKDEGIDLSSQLLKIGKLFQ